MKTLYFVVTTNSLVLMKLQQQLSKQIITLIGKRNMKMTKAKCGASNPPAGKSAKVKMMGGGMAMKKKPGYSYGGMAAKKKK